MAEKNRNFRSSYYDKVGFRVVEEKKSLEEIFIEKPMDKEKLSKFCLRFTLPAIYREYVWQVLLGVLPVNSESHESISQQRLEHYEEILNDLKIMRLVEDDTSKPDIHALMLLLIDDAVEFDIKKQLSEPKYQNLVALASFFLETSSKEVIAFWMLRNFMLHQKKFILSTKLMKEQLESILKKEDDPLYKHFKSINALELLPLDKWFESYFDEVLHENSRVRICDKIIGGSCKILPYVAAALLMFRRKSLLLYKDKSDIIENPEDTSDVIVNKALDLYYISHQ